MPSNLHQNDKALALLPYTEVFSDGPVTFEGFKALLKPLSRTDVLFWCARVNLLLGDSKTDHKQQQRQCVNLLYSQHLDKINDYASQHGGVDAIVIVHRGALLEMIRYACLLCADHPDDSRTFESENVRAAFARSLLMASDLWGQRVFSHFPSDDTPTEQRRQSALAIFRRAMMEGPGIGEAKYSLCRGYDLLTKHMPPKFAETFHERFSLALEDFFLCTCLILVYFTNTVDKSEVGLGGDNGIFSLKRILRAAPHMQQALEAFVALFSADSQAMRDRLWGDSPKEPTEFDMAFSLRPLRDTPILRAKDGRLIVLDPVLLLEMAEVGPLFHLNGCDTTTDWLTEFGHAFERYAESVFRYMYPDAGDSLARRLYCSPKNANDSNIEVADFIIDGGDSLVLVEAKAVWFRDDNVNSAEPEKFRGHLLSKYRGDDKNPKGILQLTRGIRNLITQTWTFSGLDIANVRAMYPVLLVHDKHLDAPLFGHYLGSEFMNLYAPVNRSDSKWIRDGRTAVAPLTVMTIHDLECLASSLGRFSLSDLLNDYSNDDPERMMSLHDYIGRHKTKYPIYHSKKIADRYSQITRSCCLRFFPDGKLADKLRVIGNV